MVEAVKNPPDADFWAAALRAKYFGAEGEDELEGGGKEEKKGICRYGREDWDGVLGEFQVCCACVVYVVCKKNNQLGGADFMVSGGE